MGAWIAVPPFGPYGNTTTYTYADKNDDDFAFEPTTIATSIDGHVTTFQYIEDKYDPNFGDRKG